MILMAITTKTCTKCGETKTLGYFGIDRRRPDKKCLWCRVCKGIASSDWSKKNPVKKNKIFRAKCYDLKNKYGITFQEFGWMLVEQNGGCKVCDKTLLGKNTHVDHCHDTGKVRGLLCTNCNWGIGQLGDSLERLRAAVKYLEETQT